MRVLILIFLCAFFLSNGLKSVSNDVLPVELYIIDVPEIPKATGKKGTSYTASVFIVDNQNKEVLGPYRGSSFPNSKESVDKNGKGTDKPNTLIVGAHLFNNKNGHKGGTVKGLNLINPKAERIVEGFSWTKKPSLIHYANVHSGYSDNGNFNSRGSMGCITIHPHDQSEFFENFDFNKGTKGNSKGVVYIFRDSEVRRKELIKQIKLLYNEL